MEKVSNYDDRFESLDDRKNRIRSLWKKWVTVRENPILLSLFKRTRGDFQHDDVREILRIHGYPERSNIADLEFEDWSLDLNLKFVKDGYIYLLRGDHPNLEKKGFYTRAFAYGQMSTESLQENLRSSEEVGYFLYNDERYLGVAKPSSESIAQELAMKQSQRGGSSYISTTTSFLCAAAGTGNSPDESEQSTYEIYVIRMPIDNVIASNTGNFYGLEEDEYLVPDCIHPDEVVAKFSRDDRDGVYNYMHSILGVSREDLRL